MTFLVNLMFCRLDILNGPIFKGALLYEEGMLIGLPIWRNKQQTGYDIILQNNIGAILDGAI